MKKLILGLSALAATVAIHADDTTTQTVTIDGNEVGKQVQAVAFDGDNLTLSYTDGSTSGAVDMSTVVIVFNESTGIQALSTEEGPVYYFDLNGRQLPQAPAQGVYLMKRGQKVVKVAQQN